MVRQHNQKSPAAKTFQAFSPSPQPAFQPSEPLTTEAPKNPNFRGLSSEFSMPIQAKLTVGEPNDTYEQEADKIAAQVVQKIHTPTINQSEDNSTQYKNTSPDITPLKISSLQRETTTDGNAVSSGLESSINRARGTGKPLPNSLRPKMENAFGSDLGSVRVHDNAGADQLSQSIQAKAFTAGKDIFFKKGEYKPQTTSGQKLLAHELTHTIQQNNTPKSAVKRSIIQRTVDEKDYRNFTPEDEAKYPRIAPVHTCSYTTEKNKTFDESEKIFKEMYTSSAGGVVVDGLGFDPDKYEHLTNTLINKYEEEVLTHNPDSGTNSMPREVMEGGNSPEKEYQFTSTEATSIYSLHITYGGKIVTLTPRVPTTAGLKFAKAQKILYSTGNGSVFGEHDLTHSGTHYANTPPGGTHLHFISKNKIKLDVIDRLLDYLVDKALIAGKDVAFKVRKAFNTPGYEKEKQLLELAASFMERQKQDPYGGVTSSVPTPDVPE
ncbi:MAG: DUF4157 domain-containing protein [Limnothrix sp. RL_2_0]|nr:DUF4157 domain-containing protein [Limnothrix sp. RL_2_0]